VLCFFSTVDDLTDLFSVVFHATRTGPPQVRTAGQSDDDQDEYHHATGTEYCQFVFATTYSSTVFNEFVAAASWPAQAGRPRAASGGRAPPLTLG